MKITGFYRVNGLDEEDSRQCVVKFIEELRPQIEELYGSFKVKFNEIKQLEEDFNYYGNVDKCFRVYFTVMFNIKEFKEDINMIGLYFYTKIKIED